MNPRVLKVIMTRNYRPVQARLGRAPCFKARTAPAAPFRATQTSALELLKNRLTDRLVQTAVKPELNVLYRRAANDAAALAWATPFPLLLFPLLLEERAVVAQRQLERQESVWRRSHPSKRAGTRLG